MLLHILWGCTLRTKTKPKWLDADFFLGFSTNFTNMRISKTFSWFASKISLSCSGAINRSLFNRSIRYYGQHTIFLRNFNWFLAYKVLCLPNLHGGQFCQSIVLVGLNEITSGWRYNFESDNHNDSVQWIKYPMPNDSLHSLPIISEFNDDSRLLNIQQKPAIWYKLC